MGVGDDACEYAKSLARQLEQIGVEVSSDFVNMFVGEAARVGRENFRDLGTLLVIECLECSAKGTPVAADDVRRLLGRVRKRLSRETAKWNSNFSQITSESAFVQNDRGLAQVEVAEVVRHVLKELKTQDLMMVIMVMDGANSLEIGERFGMSSSTVRQWLHRIREKLATRFGHFII